MLKVKVDGVSKIFTKRKKAVIALSDVNLEIETGTLFGILGQSGAGKTTLMRIIAGLETPSEGKVFLDGQLVSASKKIIVPPERRNISMVFQTWALYPNMTAYSNIAFPLINKRVANDEIKKRIEEISEMLDISHILSHHPRELSGGQQQRVAIARAIVKNPSLLIMDEPFSNLDTAIRDSARALVRRVQMQFKMTALIVSHDPADIFAISEKAAVVEAAKIVQSAIPIEIYESPKNTLVSRIMGEINIMGGEVIKSTRGKEIKVDNLLFPINLEQVTDGTEILIGLRPEDLEIINEDTQNMTSSEWSINGKVKVSVSSYSSGVFRIIVNPVDNSNREIIVLSDKPASIGDQFILRAKRKKIKLFDHDTQKLISSGYVK